MSSYTDAKLHWEFGTAYDFFVSQLVLHHPERFSLRPNWAAGVRSRLNPELRQTLEHAENALPMPIRFVFNLPGKTKTLMRCSKSLEAWRP